MNNFPRFTAVPDLAWKDPRLNRTDCSVLGKLNSWWHTTGDAHPSAQNLANDLGRDVSTIRKSIRKLDSLGWIQRKQRRTSKTTSDTNHYFPGPNLRKSFKIEVGGSAYLGVPAYQRDQLPDQTHSDRWYDDNGTLKSGGSLLHVGED